MTMATIRRAFVGLLAAIAATSAQAVPDAAPVQRAASEETEEGEGRVFQFHKV